VADFAGDEQIVEQRGRLYAYMGRLMFLLAIDVGNSTISLGLFREGGLIDKRHLATDLQKNRDEYRVVLIDWLGDRKLTDVILASVVPALTPVMLAVTEPYAVAVVVTHATSTGLRIRTGPEQVGADRLVNAAIAFHRFGGAGKGVGVIDFGTATTLTFVSHDGEYLGGAIAPGLATSASALTAKTAQLPQVSLARPSSSAIGADTVSAIRSGLFLSQIGLVEEGVRRAAAELGGLSHVVATGGLCHLVVPECPSITDICPDLTLEGLAWLHTKSLPLTPPGRP
jgi:type III pantothenate kinase